MMNIFQSGDGKFYGWFEQVIWQGLQSTTPGGGGPDLGARTIQLIQ